MSTAHPRPWRRGSLFTDGPRHPLDREQRAVWRARLDIARRGGRITATHAEVGRALVRRLGQDGRLDPSHETIAGDAGCSDRTVRRALEALAGCGLVRWVRRLVRDGWRAVQTSNAYELTAPGQGTPCGGQNGRGIRKIDLSLRASARSQRQDAPSSGSDEWARWNAERQLRLLAG
jgi:AraC-like DNA-binding protein